VTTRRCVVTGAGGFIGYHLANALAADGHVVVGIDLHFPDAHGALGPPRFLPVTGDFRDAAVIERALDGTQVVFHLASAHLQVNLPEAEYWDVNVHSLPTLMSRARQAGVSRFVHTSSVGVFGDVGAAPATEDTPPQPQSIYGETKLAGERTALEYGRAHAFDVVVLRPAWVYGAGCPRTSKLCRALRKRRFVMIGAGQNLRHPVYIDDMIEAFKLAAIHPGAVGETFIIAGERPVTARELVETFCTVFGYRKPAVRVPYGIATALASTTEAVCGLIGREPPFSRRTLEFFNTNNAFDISRARTGLGFAPTYSLPAGLAAMRDWVAAAA
jgi:nucleoside-diphosphate-sugar epimerase